MNAGKNDKSAVSFTNFGKRPGAVKLSRIDFRKFHDSISFV